MIAVSLLGCSSSSYIIDRQTEGRTQLLVTSDRVALQCLRLTDYEGDIPDPHLFSINVLDEVETVVTVSQDNIVPKVDCLRKAGSIAEILNHGEKIFIGGMGNLKKPRISQLFRHSFPRHGQFPENGRNLQFMTIWNDKGTCFSAYSEDQKDCPIGEFPITP